MIPEICLCFAEADRPVAESVAARLEQTAEVRVWPEPLRGPVTEGWDRGLGSAGILLCLSPDSVPPKVEREAWAEILDQVTPPVASLLVRECAHPKLMERRRFYRWSDANVLRDLQRWAVGLHPVPDPPPFVPAPVPGIPAENMEALWTTLVDRPGDAEAESTDMAQQFAHAAAPWFRDVVWIACARRSPACIAGEISALLGVVLDGPENGAFARAVELARSHRLLLVLDGLEPDASMSLPDGPGSVLVTKRAEIPRATSEPADSALFEAMSACVPGGFPLELVAAMIGVERDAAVPAADRLVAGGVVARLDPTGSRLRLCARAHPRKVEAMRVRHAQTLRDAFTRYAADPAGCVRLVPEVELAIRWAVMRDWQLAQQLTQSAASFLRHLGRASEAAFLFDILLWAANDRGDKQVADNCEWELSWIRGGVEGSLRAHTPPIEQMGFEF